jgi:photosynthetic reaction center H subunit
MPTGQTTEHFDVAFLAINAFFLFFAGLIYYLRREDKREGYPLLEEGAGRLSDGIYPATPPKKTFLLQDGTTLTLPREPSERTVALKQVRGPTEGSPFVPTGNPLVDAVGPASYAQREDHPDMTWEGEARIVPLRVAKDFWIAEGDPDARGWEVIAADGKVAGTIKEAWIDRAEPQVFYYEVAIPGGVVILPARLAIIDDDAKKVLVESITAAQFADVPRLKNPDQITLLEEDKISGYFAGGHLYATPDRQEPIA